MFKVSKKDIRMTPLYIFPVSICLLFLKILHTLLLRFYCWVWVGKCQLRKFLSLNENANEKDILRVNGFFDFIIIIFTVIFIIWFYFAFTVINFSNLYFWIIKIHFLPLLEIFSDLSPSSSREASHFPSLSKMVKYIHICIKFLMHKILLLHQF